MSVEAADARPTVAIVGGGLAGLAAAAALSELPCRVRLLEAGRTLGGRAASFRDPATGELVDLCQHVGMGCCTNLADFCRRTGIDGLFRRDRAIHFIGPDGRHYPFSAVNWLPAPLHLAPGFWRLKHLSLRDRIAIGRAMARLMRTPACDTPEGPTVAAWLAANGQSPAAIDGFWRVVLVSALGDTLERASLAAARKVLVDGFLGSRDAYVVDVPETPLGELYGERLVRWLTERGVEVSLASPAGCVTKRGRPCVALAGGDTLQADHLVLAVPWSKVAALVDARLGANWPWLAAATRFESAPITGVHLWFDRPIVDLPHAVLVGRLSQWMFNRGPRTSGDGATSYYYQVVISASYELAERDRSRIAAEVQGELAQIWPDAASAKLVNSRVVTEQAAVFSPQPGIDAARPSQQSPTDGVYLAGDWTSTGWPATMESAVRSGYLAAEAVSNALGCPRTFLVDDLPRGLLARALIR